MNKQRKTFHILNVFQYDETTVGKVWKVLEDGRAWIAVKIG